MKSNKFNFTLTFNFLLLQATTTLLKCILNLISNQQVEWKPNYRAKLKPRQLTARANRKRTEDLTLLSQSFSAEAEDPRKSEEKQEGASSDDIYGSIDQLLQ